MQSRLSPTVFAVLFCGMVAVAAIAQSAEYLGPTDVVAAKDGKTLFVLNEDAGQVAVLDVAAGKVTRTIPCPPKPTGLVLSPSGEKLIVTCAAPTGSVALVDLASGKVTATVPAGHGARAPAISPDGKRLYVCNQFDNDVSVIDLATGKQIVRVPAVREPFDAAVTPDGKTVFVTNLIPNDQADAYDVASEITVIDAASNKASSIRLLNGSSSLRGICVSPDGKYAYAAHILARYQMPTTQLERGWMNTNAMSIIDVAAKKLVNIVLLDDIDLGAANPWDVGVTPDGKSICVSHAGTHELSVIDSAAMFEKLASVPADEKAAKEGGAYDDRGTYSSATQADIPNDLAFLVGLRRRIRLPGRDPWAYVGDPKVNSPRGLAVVGSKVYIAVYFSDVLAVVDLEPKPGYPVSTVALGPPPKMSVARRGEMLFHDASLCFQHWQSCSSCHPGARTDGLNWDLMNDGMGNPKNVRTMLLTHKTPPSMSSGIRVDAEAAVRSGLTHIQFAVRPEEDAAAMDEYLKSLQPVPSPALIDGKLSTAAKRGQELFTSERLDCAKCHPAPLYSDLEMHDVKSRGQYDRRDDFDTPTLVECWRTAPYMHDGHYVTLKSLFTEGKHGMPEGDAGKLSEQQINDLVEFVRSL